jgi:hypothetical protein
MPDAGQTTSLQLGPWIVAFSALAQPWIIAAFKRLRRGSIEIYESGNIQVGYGGLGPSVALKGTLRGIGNAVFVKRLQVVVRRTRDSARCEMGWSAERKPGGAADEPVRAFLLTSTQTVNYDVLFAEEAFVSQMRGRIDDIAERWKSFLIRAAEEMSKNGPRVGLNDIIGNVLLIEDLFGKFAQEVPCRNLWADLNNRMYWEAGTYELQLSAETAEGTKFPKRWHFQVTDDDSNRLRNNAASAVRAAANMTTSYASAYPRYEEVS